MEKVILKGSKATQWDLGNGFRDGGIPLELSDAEMKKAKASNLIETIISDKPIEAKPVEVISTVKKYTQEELEKLTFTQLKEIGKGINVTSSSKAGIITKILEAQK